jgi:TRAP-type C4-dicarboxylate transport system permease small subunit
MVARMGDAIARTVELTLAILLAVMTALVVLQVFCRYVLNSPLTWAEEAARLAMIWLAFLGASVALWRHRHIRIEGLVESLPPALGLLIQRGIDSAVLLLLGVLAVQSWNLVLATRRQFTAALQLPVSYAYYASICVGMVLMTVYQAVMIVRNWRARAEAPIDSSGEAR